jgi:uncharacterized membrane protein YphA (DoxX/SURF4 family)
MALSRRIARPLLASIFVAGGLDALRNPAAKAPKAEVVTTPVGEQVGMDPELLIRVNGAVQVGAGVLLATGKFRRLASLALIGSIVPTTYAGHRFWEETDPVTRAQQRMHFLKNVGLLGGLILAAFDTEGEPSLSWRTKRRAHRIESALALGGAAGHSSLRRTARRSLAQASHVTEAARAGAPAALAKIDLEPAQQLAAAGAAAAKHLPSAVNEGIRTAGEAARTAGEAARKAAQGSSGTAADTVHQATSAVGTAVSQWEPLAEKVTKAGLETLSPYLNLAAEKAAGAIAKLPDPRTA